ncbi:hypothetical protein [Sorangium sp. So ce388]|uniref:hypothetical protein n=1 Tax=Sorangium sp. So ce388 TaxID=3133309 RepID=UPI003F5BE406
MGPITGIRVVNLRVRDKVAYPDLTLDLASDGADHLVIGLENGGGKSTLLGAIYHVLVPEADQFLPRRAQRRQHKEGELKRLEHYVPGGDPTHFIVEVEPPAPDGVLPILAGPRLLVGACLWKPAGSPPSMPAGEFFWSARSVAPELSLRDLALRGPGGRLLDYREFRAKLKQLRTDAPAAQVNVEEGKGAWEMHLRNLGIDVDYVRQFLLRMNEDEGAADQVFTYASSRAFLNSLVGVVGDPTAIEQLKQRLAEMAQDADAIRLDRQRVVLLESLAAQTGPLAETVKHLEERVAERDRAIGHGVASQERLTRHLEAVREACGVAAARRVELDRIVADARAAYHEAHARYGCARVQMARLLAEAAAGDMQRTEQERDRTRTEERVARAAALLADRRTNEARIRDVKKALKARAAGAEPLRRALSSALQALGRRLAADIERLDGERRELSAAEARAAGDLERAGNQRAEAARTLGALDGERKGLSRERAALERQLAAAIEAGVLADATADPAVELRRTRARAASEKAAAEEHERHRRGAVEALRALGERDRQLAGEAGRAEESVTKAQAELEGATRRTHALASTLGASGFIETHPVVLDDHAGTIRQRLGEVIEAARRKQAGAALSVAVAERAAVWLRDHERLPPRPDVERLCERARAERLGARPGWAYLARLPADAAGAYAFAHPGLADGIVVNIPEDLKAVVELVSSARDELDGPVVVGPATAFDRAPGELDASATVVLPHSAHWSADAARELVETRSAEAARWRAEHDGATARADAAFALREQLSAWVADVGVGGLDARRTALRKQREAQDAIATARAALASDIAARTAERDAAEARRDAARDRERDEAVHAQKLEGLAGVRERMTAIDARIDAIDAEETDATRARDAALAAMAEARQRQESARSRSQGLATHLGELTGERARADSLAAVAVQPGDAIDAADEVADRHLLAERARDREHRWRGALTDPELRAQLMTLESAVADIEKQLGEYAGVLEPARALIVADPARSADDHRRSAEDVRKRVESLAGRIGELTAAERQLKAELEKAQEEFRALRRPAELAPDETTADVDEAAAVRDRLRSRRDAAASVRTEREGELQAAADMEKITTERGDLIALALQRLNAAVRRLATGGVLVPAVDLAERATSAVLADAPLPDAMAILLRVAARPLEHEGAAGALDADKISAAAALDRVDADTDALRRALDTLDRGAGAALDTVEALLRDAAEDVVRGDRIVQTLRAAPRRTLADLAAAHHEDIAQRLTAVRHHVASFDARVDALAETAYATVADLLREVRRTVRESQLPNTPAMGRWAGAELLQLTGLDTLKVDQRRAAVGATLRGWFNPDRPEDRPRKFDSDEVVHELLRSVTPQFAARILIPSDPLDPEHKPVDHLALETSGGEGVTVALVLASLLASRRASARGHRRTTLLLDNPFAKVTKPEFLRLARDVADELDVQLVALTGIRDLGALTVFPRLTQLRVSRRENANFVVPYGIEDDRLQPLLRDGTLYVSPTEWAAARQGDTPSSWPLMSVVGVASRRAG